MHCHRLAGWLKGQIQEDSCHFWVTSFLGICQQLCLLCHIQVSWKETGLCSGWADLEAVAEAGMVPGWCGSHCAFSRDGGTEAVSSAENPELCGGGRCWQRSVANWSFEGEEHDSLRSGCLWVWVISLCSATAQMNSGDAGHLDSVESCPVFGGTVLLSCWRCGKERSCVCTGSALTLLPAPGMCLLPVLWDAWMMSLMSGCLLTCLQRVYPHSLPPGMGMCCSPQFSWWGAEMDGGRSVPRGVCESAANWIWVSALWGWYI